MQAPRTPPGRASSPRPPPSPTFGAYEELQTTRYSLRRTGPLASPPASPTASPMQPMLHGRAACKRSNNGSSSNLPTPSETPFLTPTRKRQRASSMQESARVLSFQPENPNDIMPTAKDTRRNKVHITGDDGDFRTDISRSRKSAKNSVQVYTEVQARVPQADLSTGNVFLDVPRGRSTTVSEPSRRTGHWVESPSPPRPQKSAAQKFEDARLQAAVDRGEGVFMMFRGKKLYRSFAEDGVEDLSAWSRQQQQLKNAAGGTALRPITRSSIRPRLLWDANGHEHDLPVETSHTDEEAETDVDMSDVDATESQEQDSGISFGPSAVHTARVVRDTPGKQKKPSRKPMMSPPTTSRTTRQTKFDKIPSFEETLEADDEAHSLAALPTPQRSLRKKKASLNAIAIYEDDAPVPETPARTRSMRSAPQLASIVEDDDEPTSAGQASTGEASSGVRSKPSLFDSWQRTKSGRKRDNEAIAGDVNDAPAKRSRSGARSKASSA